MQRRVLFAGFRACLAALALLLALPAAAQLPTTIRVIPQAGAVDDLLRRGTDLEGQRRWSEALAHYEDAMRQFPGDAALQRRFDLARLHFDLERRYADRSFRDTLTRLSPEAAVDLYGQVLLKIETHYVEAPRWKELVERGLLNLDVALGEPRFIERNLPRADRAAVDKFAAEAHALVAARAINSRDDARTAVAQCARLAEQRLTAPAAAVVLECLCGAAGSLDPYSTYLTPDQLNDVYAQIEGNFVGLGVELKSQNGGLTIVRVIPGSPAAEGGVRTGDEILVVDGQSTRTLSTEQASSLLQGVDGSAVTLTVAAQGQQSRQVTIRRRRVEVPSVDQVGIVDAENGIGYFKLTCFQKTTVRDLDAALWRLHRDGMKTLIVDLRGNPGGLLTGAVEVASRFIDRGTIVSTRGRNTQEDSTYSAQGQGAWQMPLVVIIDQDSASAAEIFAGAIRDHRRGTIVGVRSYGKGSVQGIFPLDGSNAGVRLTTSKFYSPSGHPISRVGVEPDIAVQTVAKPIAGGAVGTVRPEDGMLSAAVQTARSLNRPLQARNAR